MDEPLVQHAVLRNAEAKTRPDHFEAWCWRVMNNYLNDWLRRRRTDPLARTTAGPDDGPPLLDAQADPAQAQLQADLEAALDRQVPLPDSDLAYFRRQHARHRVVLLCLSYLWPRVPAADWHAWVAEAGLPPPFPPPEFAQLRQTEVTGQLAAALGVPRNTINKIWHRHVEELRNLQSVRECRHDA